MIDKLDLFVQVAHAGGHWGIDLITDPQLAADVSSPAAHPAIVEDGARVAFGVCSAGVDVAGIANPQYLHRCRCVCGGPISEGAVRAVAHRVYRSVVLQYVNGVVFICVGIGIGIAAAAKRAHEKA